MHKAVKVIIAAIVAAAGIKAGNAIYQRRLAHQAYLKETNQGGTLGGKTIVECLVEKDGSLACGAKGKK